MQKPKSQQSLWQISHSGVIATHLIPMSLRSNQRRCACLAARPVLCVVLQHGKRQNVTKLENGKIPAYTPCPFRGECGSAKLGLCHHFGEYHRVAFSCGTARLFDMLESYNQERKPNENATRVILQKLSTHFFKIIKRNHND